MALIRAFEGKQPEISEKAAFVAENATLVGNIRLAQDVSVWYGAVLRADSDCITVGQGTNLQDNVVVHTSHGHPVHIGSNVTVGHAALVHGCTVEDDVLIGMHATVLNGAVVGHGSVVAAGALVTEGMIVPPNSLVMGVPAKVRGEVSEELRQRNASGTAGYIAAARQHAQEAAQ